MTSGEDSTLYTIPANSKVPHCAWFDKSPQGACKLIDGVEYVETTMTTVARGNVKKAYVLSFTENFLRKLVADKRRELVVPSYSPFSCRLLHDVGTCRQGLLRQ